MDIQDTILIQKDQLMKGAVEQCPYSKIRPVGQGTFGVVYEVIDSRNKNKYALKEVLQDKRYKNRQLSVVLKINHPNVVSVIDHFFRQKSQECYLNLVMQFIPYCLQNLIKDQRKLKQSFSMQIRKILTFQLLKAFFYLEVQKQLFIGTKISNQRKQICHRDCKPSNILVKQNFQLKICDFGSAKILEKEQNNIFYICSRYYRAPQLVLGSTSYGTEIDMWSVGCIIVELLTCEPIFPGDTSQEQLIEIMKVLGTPPSHLIAKCSFLKKNLAPFTPLKWTKVLSRYNPEPELVDLISRILVYEKRYTPIETLMHPYFKDLPTYKTHVQNIPNLLLFDGLHNGKDQDQLQLLEKMYGNQFKFKHKTNVKEDIVGSKSTRQS